MGGSVWVNPKPSIPPQLCVLSPPGFSSYIKTSVIRPTAGVSVTSSPIPRSRKVCRPSPPDRLRRPGGTSRHEALTPPRTPCRHVPPVYPRKTRPTCGAAGNLRRGIFPQHPRRKPFQDLRRGMETPPLAGRPDAAVTARLHRAAIFRTV
jgi:hypothetical protein